MSISIQASVSKGWLHREGGFIFDAPYYADPIHRKQQDAKINAFVAQRFPQWPIYAMEDNLVQAEHVTDKQILVGAIQPNMILAAMLGASFTPSSDKDADVDGYPLAGMQNIEGLPSAQEMLASPFIKDLDAQINRLKTECPELDIIPPFFWDASGRATIHGILTTSLKLIGEEVMILMMTDPDWVHAVHRWIIDAYETLIRHYADMCGLKITSVHVGECSGTMFSGDMFEEFAVPYLSLLSERLGPLRLHSCGKSDHLISAFASIKGLSIIDTGSNTSIKTIRDTFGNNIEINTFPSTALLMKGSSQEEIIHWVQRVLDDNNGGKLKIAYHLEADYDENNALAIHETLASLVNCTQTRLY